MRINPTCLRQTLTLLVVFTIIAANAQTPEGIPGATSWFKANNGVIQSSGSVSSRTSSITNSSTLTITGTYS